MNSARVCCSNVAPCRSHNHFAAENAAIKVLGADPKFTVLRFRVAWPLLALKDHHRGKRPTKWLHASRGRLVGTAVRRRLSKVVLLIALRVVIQKYHNMRHATTSR